MQIIAGRARDIAYSDDLDETSTSTSSGTRAEFNPLRFKERFEDHPTCECIKENLLRFSWSHSLGKSTLMIPLTSVYVTGVAIYCLCFL